MSSLIFCPHTDDAIFSLGDYLLNNDPGFTIASAFAGIPEEPVGNKKHTILRAEHTQACNLVGASEINSTLLDDVYGMQDVNELRNWIRNIINDYDDIYVPLGIHHPDHKLLSDTLFEVMDEFNKSYYVYAELPYRILYPGLYLDRLDVFESKYKLTIVDIQPNEKKIDAVSTYDSQVDDALIEKLIVKEKLWKLER